MRVELFELRALYERLLLKLVINDRGENNSLMMVIENSRGGYDTVDQ